MVRANYSEEEEEEWSTTERGIEGGVGAEGEWKGGGRREEKGNRACKVSELH
jgi:hypothetical protein